MNGREVIIEKIDRSAAAEKPEVASLLGLWHFSRKQYPAAFFNFSVAVPIDYRFGFLAVAAWRAEWGAKPLPADFEAKAPLASGCFWAWAGKTDEGLAALKKSGTAVDRIRSFLEVYLKLLSLPPGPSSRPAEFRERLEGVVQAEFGVNASRTRSLMARYGSGDLAGTVTELRPILENFFTVPPFTSVDFLWLQFLSGVGNLDFASLSSAVAELEGIPSGPPSGWKERKRSAGHLLLYFFLLRAGLESFEKSLKINPHFAKAAKNAHLVKMEKPKLVELIKQFSVL
ncbi:MAG: hypothetical protein L0Z48_04100 [candidate division Zixibacteria bacterium]|nr:hypothetical protein [candidate division Zixibacteria bacterium]